MAPEQIHLPVVVNKRGGIGREDVEGKRSPRSGAEPQTGRRRAIRAFRGCIAPAVEAHRRCFPMRKRAFIIHGYLSHPGEAWLPWLKAELESRGFAVSLPAMPDPKHPEISVWIDFIAGLVGEPDGETVMIGHSIGAQAVLRYLERLGAAGKSVARTVLVAGAFPTGLSAAEAKKAAGGDPVLEPWFIRGVNPASVKKAAGKCTVILADNDPYIDVGNATRIYRAVLDPTIVMEHGLGHFNEDDGLTALPSALAAALA